MITIINPKDDQHLAAIRALFEQYAESLGVDLSFQHFEEELAGLPGAYAPPDGRLYLAMDGKRAAGCAGLRKMGEGVCELKRLYVHPLSRGQGIGRQLVLAAITDAHAIGYHKMRLDSLPSMRRALALYRALGFKPIEPYYDNPVAGAAFLELKLD